MAQKRYQVFVSSTYADLIDERQDILKAILDLDHIPSGMEGFFAADEEQLKYIKRIIDECDYFILIIAGRYGSVDDNGISYTEKEYHYAVSKGIRVLAFIHEDISTLPAGKVDTDPIIVARLQSFKATVSEKRLISYWHTREQLRANATVSLVKSIRDNPEVGWIRGNVSASEELMLEYANCQTEVARLKLENADLKSQLQPNIGNLASLDDKYTIRYSFYWHDRKHHETLDMSWKEIFIIIGPSFFNPATQLTISSCLLNDIQTHSRERLSLLEIFAADIDKIKIQMFAYNLMTVYSAETVQGGLGEFLQLTDYGKRMLLELATVKTALALSALTQPV